jgi:hypothetical protein
MSRLFLSADLVGSTARKQSNLDEWLTDLLGFYQQFPAMVQGQLRASREASTYELASPLADLELWKAVGDELIFTCPIREEHHVHLLIKGFVGALGEWSRWVKEKRAPLPLKGGAWIATFPLPDRAVAVIGNPGPLERDLFDPDREPEHNNRGLLEAIEAGEHPNHIWTDYVGPSMDTGFRLATHATPRRFMVSLEVAWLYAAAANGTPDADKDLFLQGEVQMKGVWGGRGYPLFWMDTRHQHAGQPVLDEIMSVAPAPAAQVVALAHALSTGDDGWVTRLYLPDSKHATLKEHHPQVEAEVNRLNRVEDTQNEIPDLPEG